MILDEAGARHWLETLAGYDDLARERFDTLVARLREENGRQNLVSAESLARVWQRHIADSAQLLVVDVPRGTSGPWLDLGSGAGFPGLVIAVLRPACAVYMVEGRRRRADWLAQMVRMLDLAAAHVVSDRLEAVVPFAAATISARAFAPLDRLLALSAAFSTSATVWLLPKGRSAGHELHNLRGWRHELRVVPSVTDPAAGIIVGNVAGRTAAAEQRVSKGARA